MTIRVIADCGSDTTQTEFLATWLEGDNAGCTDPAASNYDSSSQTDDGSCEYSPDSDGDGINDDQDLCEGHDDSADADGDGIPDGLRRRTIEIQLIRHAGVLVGQVPLPK